MCSIFEWLKNSETQNSLYKNAPKSLVQISRLLFHTRSNATCRFIKIQPLTSRKVLSKLSLLHPSTNNSKFLKPSKKNFLRTQQRNLTCNVSFYFKLLNLVKWSEVAQSCPTLCDPMDSSLRQAPSSRGFSRQEYWSGLSFPSPGNLPDPRIEPRSPTL